MGGWGATMRTYWHHPESDGFMAHDVPEDAAAFWIDGCDELTADEYADGMMQRFHAMVGPLRVVVFGGRDFSDQRLMDETLDSFHADIGIAMLIEGEANGADKRAAHWARRRGVPVEPYPADWDDITHADARPARSAGGKMYDAAAGGRRNQQMIDEGRPDCGIAFKGGSGTADMKDRCELAGVPVFDITDSTENTSTT